MSVYHKIQTVFSRDPNNKYKTLLVGMYSLPEFEYLANNSWIFTEKVDGTNIRVFLEDGEVVFGGRTDKATIPIALFDRLTKVFSSKKNSMVEMFGDSGVCLYGEGYGANIQKTGRLYRADQDFVLFDVKDGDTWLSRHEVERVSDLLGLMIVPVIGEGTLLEMVGMAKRGFTSRWGEFTAEGVVARPKIELLNSCGNRIITKIKYKDFIK